MKVHQCYQLLDLVSGASLIEIRAAYRRLARLVHPDLHSTDRYAQKRFVALNQAYQILQSSVKEHGSEPCLNTALDQAAADFPAPLSTFSQREIDLKWNTYRTLQDLLQHRKLNQAVAVVDGLAQRHSQDLHIRQWQGIVYYFLGQHLIDLGQISKAKIYLKKAEKADPQNVQLSQQINWEHQRIARIMT